MSATYTGTNARAATRLGGHLRCRFGVEGIYDGINVADCLPLSRVIGAASNPHVILDLNATNRDDHADIDNVIGATALGVSCLAVDGRTIYAGGGGATMSLCEVAPDGMTWLNQDPNEMPNNAVTKLIHDGTDLHASGSFTSAGGVGLANNFGVWNATAGWRAPGKTSTLVPWSRYRNLSGTIYACSEYIETWGGVNYAPAHAGYFSSFGPPFWFPYQVSDCAVYGGQLIAAGFYTWNTTSPVIPMSGLDFYNGAVWATLAGGGIHPGQCHTCYTFGGLLWAGSATAIKTWDGANWVDTGSAVGSSLITEINGTLVALGIGPGGASQYWDGAAWQAYAPTRSGSTIGFYDIVEYASGLPLGE